MDQGKIEYPDASGVRMANDGAYRREVRWHDAVGWDAHELPIEQVRDVWAARAARLAEAPVTEAAGECMPLIPLRLGHELYAVDVQFIVDIRPLEGLTRVPRVPAWVAGITNLRGRIYSVIHLQRYLGARHPTVIEDGRQERVSGWEESRYFVVVETPDMGLVLLVDDVLPLQDVQLSRVLEVTGDVQVVRPEYVRGISETDGGEAMVILDLPVLLADGQLIVNEDLG